MYFVKLPIDKKELTKLRTLKHEFKCHTSGIKHQNVRMYVYIVLDGNQDVKMTFK